MKIEELEKALEVQEKVLEETKKHLENIKVEIKKLNDNGFEPTPKGWEPDYDESYFYADAQFKCFGEINRNTQFDEDTFKYNRIFKTKEECQLYCDIQRAFRNASRDFDINKANFFLFYGYERDAIDYSCQNRAKRDNLYFDSEETIQSLINKFGEENIKRYYLGVY